MLPKSVLIDKDRIKQILANLITNAIKFTQYGGKVDILAEASLDNHFFIKVKDNGVGITKEMQQKLFTIDIEM